MRKIMCPNQYQYESESDKIFGRIYFTLIPVAMVVFVPRGSAEWLARVVCGR